MANHPAPPLVVTDTERASLLSFLRAGTAGQRFEMRARIVLAAADGTANEQIAARLGVHRMTVLLWRGRFERDRMAGLADAPRPGRQPTYDQAARDRVIALTLEPPPARMTHWSSRAIAAQTGISVTTIQRIWTEAGLRPHRTDTFAFRVNREFVPRVRDVVGLYLAPPERAFVLRVGEATYHAPDGGTSILPVEPGRAASYARNNTRDGTARLLVALNATGKETPRIHSRRAIADFLAFLRLVERAYPEGEVHVVLDNVIFHKAPAVLRWVDAHPKANFHFHLTPASASWMNQIETWFRVLSRQALRRGSLRSVQDLTTMIAAFSAQWNEGSIPFKWVKSADRIPTSTGGEPRTIAEPER